MNYFSQSGIIEKISQKITQPKQALYSEQPIFLAMSYNDTHQYVDSIVYNKYEERLKVSLFFNKDSRHESCIVYMHGYGSNRMEAIYLLRYLPTNISLCCFDFSAQGKSDGKIITFGQKQKDDIKAVLGYLRSSGYKKFILWGRSMGATCTLLHNIKYKPDDVILQILDSPFISFHEAALQLTKKRISIPEIIIKLALEALCKNLQNKQYNPFEIDFNKPIQCDIPAIFIYSERDQVINSQNSKKIIQNFKAKYQKIIINQLHNVGRKADTIRNIINIIKRYTSKKIQKLKQNSQELPMGIQNIIKTKIFSKKSSLNNYGIWVSTKEINDQVSTQRNSERMRQARSTNSHYSRPKSSIKVFSKISRNSQSYNSETNKDQIMSTRSSFEKQRFSLKNKLSYDFYINHQILVANVQSMLLMHLIKNKIILHFNKHKTVLKYFFQIYDNYDQQDEAGYIQIIRQTVDLKKYW